MVWCIFHVSTLLSGSSKLSISHGLSRGGLSNQSPNWQADPRCQPVRHEPDTRDPMIQVGPACSLAADYASDPYYYQASPFLITVLLPYRIVRPLLVLRLLPGAAAGDSSLSTRSTIQARLSGRVSAPASQSDLPDVVAVAR